MTSGRRCGTEKPEGGSGAPPAGRPRLFTPGLTATPWSLSFPRCETRSDKSSLGENFVMPSGLMHSLGVSWDWGGMPDPSGMRGNPTAHFSRSPAVDGCIHRAAGSLLTDECRTLQNCETGKAKITCGYRLPAKRECWRGTAHSHKGAS